MNNLGENSPAETRGVSETFNGRALNSEVESKKVQTDSSNYGESKVETKVTFLQLKQQKFYHNLIAIVTLVNTLEYYSAIVTKVVSSMESLIIIEVQWGRTSVDF